MIVLLTFICFLFYKILSRFLFDVSLTTLSAALMGICTGFILLASVAFLARIDADHPRGPGRAGRIGGLLVGGIAMNAVMGWLIVQGFSERFSRELQGYGSGETLAWFIVMMAIPIVTVYLIGAWIAHSDP